MTLQEEHDKHTQQHSRLARERLDLSASMKTTFADPPSQELRRVDEVAGHLIHEARNTALIPPRLSLQSKVLPAVRPEMQPAFHPVTATDVAVEQKMATPRDTSMLVRLRQRFISFLEAFLEAFGSVMYSGVVPLLPPPQPEYTHEPRPLTNTVLSTYPAQEAAQSLQSKQRLAGYTAKVQLETAPMPVVSRGDVEERKPVITEAPAPPHEDVRERIPTSMAPYKETGTSAHLPVVDLSRRDVGSPPRGARSGSALFERGQSDVMVASTSVTESSVVMVTLTAHPGPVAVHYVSLQPQVGFTVHLTAPATVKTPFNYVVLLGELF